MISAIRRLKRGRIAEGEIETCAHRVSWWVGIPAEMRLTKEDVAELLECLEVEAEERAKECIIEGYVSGELCHCYHRQRDEKDFELHGWWDIER